MALRVSCEDAPTASQPSVQRTLQGAAVCPGATTGVFPFSGGGLKECYWAAGRSQSMNSTVYSVPNTKALIVLSTL
jgi:hypothetical protein